MFRITYAEYVSGISEQQQRPGGGMQPKERRTHVSYNGLNVGWVRKYICNFERRRRSGEEVRVELFLRGMHFLEGIGFIIRQLIYWVYSDAPLPLLH